MNRASYPDLDDHIELGWRWELTIALPQTYDPYKGNVLRANAKIVAMQTVADEDEYLTRWRFDNNNENVPDVPDDVTEHAKRRVATIMERESP